MGLFDSMKKKANDLANQAQGAFNQQYPQQPQQPYPQQGYPQQGYPQQPPPQQQWAEPEAVEEADDSDGDDYQRDYALEAQDDTARFDIGNDIESWWAAHREIEQA